STNSNLPKKNSGFSLSMELQFLSPPHPLYWTLIQQGLTTYFLNCQTGLRLGNIQKWWEKGLQPNMKEVTSAQDLVLSLLTAGDKLVVVDFFSPGCGGCKALHPKV